MPDTSDTEMKAHLDAWEQVHASRGWGRYPPEELVRFMARRFGGGEPADKRVLEVGCGPGANLGFLAREGYRIAGIDGSPTAIGTARRKLGSEIGDGAAEAADLRDGNFAQLPWKDAAFDVVIDIEAIYANPMAVIKDTVREVHRVLVPDGWFFGKMFGIKTTGAGTGPEVERNTSRNPTKGPCAGFGYSHFFEEDELRDLFADFAALDLDWVQRTDHSQTVMVFEWLVSARK